MSGRLPAMETVRMALSTLRGNRLRSLLTMLGIVIGNASVITLVGVGRGAQGLAEEQLEQPRRQCSVCCARQQRHATTRRGLPEDVGSRRLGGHRRTGPSVKRVAPQISSSQVVQAGARSASSSISGITPEFLPVRSFEIAQGRFISQNDLDAARSVVVIGPDLRTKLFPTGNLIGERLRIRDQSFEVVGVMAPKVRSSAAIRTKMLTSL